MTTENTGTATDTGEQTTKETPQNQVPASKPEPGSVPYSRFQEVVEQRKGLETTLNSLVDGMISELPEDVRDLVPSLPPAEKAAWIRNAQARGLFNKPSHTVETPTSSPDVKRPGGKTTIDLDNMTPLQMMQSGYGQK